ncbi:hypothetical protein TEA_015425 [Camellia sinensis var. sinensis]|uniref:Proteasome subunit beta type-3 n=1 Tax=Camellia sinensis var. sinensis TaxID=542762 RepID=A0A4S4DY26_CAMSN|nr:hypothetical protein TEA_015425 [Camellia sinensis var. sinensis]
MNPPMMSLLNWPKSPVRPVHPIQLKNHRIMIHMGPNSKMLMTYMPDIVLVLVDEEILWLRIIVEDTAGVTKSDDGDQQLASLRELQDNLCFMIIFEYNGSALVAMVGKNCFAIASDRRLGVQLQTIATDFQRIYKIHDKLFIGLAGLATDSQTMYQRLVFRHKLYQLREERDMKPQTFASLVSALLYEKRFGPYFCQPVIAGLGDDDKPFICTMDSIGAKELAKDFVVAGTASESLYGACEAMFKPDMISSYLRRRDSLSIFSGGRRWFSMVGNGGWMLLAVVARGSFLLQEVVVEGGFQSRELVVGGGHCGEEAEELFETISQALLSSVDRDCLSGWGGHVYVVSACGSTWDFICYIENFCVAHLLKLAMVSVLFYFVLLFLYSLYKLGVCRCFARTLCKTVWACFATCFFTVEHGCTFLCYKLPKLKRKYRKRKRDIKRFNSSSTDEEDRTFPYHVPRHMEDKRSLSRHWKDYRGDHLRRSLRPRSHRVRVGIRGDSVHVNKRNSMKYGHHGRTVHDIRVTRTSQFAQKGANYKGSTRRMRRKVKVP